jgi:hypothetical protein
MEQGPKVAFFQFFRSHSWLGLTNDKFLLDNFHLQDSSTTLLPLSFCVHSTDKFEKYLSQGRS